MVDRSNRWNKSHLNTHDSQSNGGGHVADVHPCHHREGESEGEEDDRHGPVPEEGELCLCQLPAHQHTVDSTVSIGKT